MNSQCQRCRRERGSTLGAQGAGYDLAATVINPAGAAALVGSVTAPHAQASNPADVSATIDVNGTTARVRVTGGPAGDNYAWQGRIEYVTGSQP